jgi:hypothetical protein
MFIIALAPLPGFEKITYIEYNIDYDTEIEYDLNDILLALMFLRVYIFARWLLFSTTFMNPRSQRVCTMNGC